MLLYKNIDNIVSCFIFYDLKNYWESVKTVHDKWASEFHDHIVNKNWAFFCCVEIEWQGQKIKKTKRESQAVPFHRKSMKKCNGSYTVDIQMAVAHDVVI